MVLKISLKSENGLFNFLKKKKNTVKPTAETLRLSQSRDIP
jgi:hypothetical protein